ncbi:Shedu anti-phage system protein SduA domain-containing protein [Flavobacterium collinsii]|uniref:Shedu anti-phage system protein SduA domain-containing protein n=1 Tax=Flavobacterium collinsii TaxID=1114861 RepID=UPI00156EAA04
MVFEEEEEKYRLEYIKHFIYNYVIMGREKKLSNEQNKDFEVAKRKYKNVIDIISYDDLLNILRFTIEQIKKS